MTGLEHTPINPPFDASFYDELLGARQSFEPDWSHVVPAGTGYGFEVDAGKAFRFVMIEGPQILDVQMLNAHDPREHFSAPTQFSIEGGVITRLTRIWGTPSQTRPIATCTADTVRTRPTTTLLRHHMGHSAHCSAHFWYLFTGQHHRPCYDNIRAGMAMLDLSQRWIHDSMNLFMKSGFDASLATIRAEQSDAEVGDYIEFFAEIPLKVALSLCPNGSGRPPDTIWDDAVQTPVYPIRIEVDSTGVEPLAWDN
jgi:uncharacterized protein